ncbi:hypothetical protein ACQKQC_24775 [Vibrio fortis]|uniref:hypothetical protein n=1 Tax=Vibrio fortis TaxID=212667 RepID=UPI004067C02F
MNYHDLILNFLMPIHRKSFASSPKKAKVIGKIALKTKVNPRSLDNFRALASRVREKKGFQAVFDPVYAFLHNGERILSEAGTIDQVFEGWVSPEQLILVKTARESGKLNEAFNNMLKLELRTSGIKSSIRKALIKPSIGIVVLMGTLIGGYQKMVPMMSELVPVEKFVGFAKFFYDLTQIFGANPEQTLTVIVSVFFFYLFGLNYLDIPKNPDIRDKYDKYIPFFGYYKRMQASIFLNALGMLMSSSVRSKEALELIRDNGSRYVKNRVDPMVDTVTLGHPLREALDAEFLGEDGQDLYDIPEGPDFNESLMVIAEESMKSVTTEVPAVLSKVGNLLLGVCAALMFSVMMAFYDMSSQIS